METKDFNAENVVVETTETETEEKAKVEEQAKTYTDAEVDKIIAAKKAKWLKQMEKEKAEAAEIAKMDAQQKAEYERDKLQKELDELRAANTRAGLIATARATLSAANVNIPDSMVATLIGDDDESTIENANTFIKDYTNSVDAAVKDKIGSQVPKKGNGTPGLTKADILKIKNPELRQKAMLENRHLFNF